MAVALERRDRFQRNLRILIDRTGGCLRVGKEEKEGSRVILVGTTVNKWWRHLLGVAQEETDLGEILFDFGHVGFEKLGKTVK